jgi:hypothetical protein
MDQGTRSPRSVCRIAPDGGPRQSVATEPVWIASLAREDGGQCAGKRVTDLPIEARQTRRDDANGYAHLSRWKVWTIRSRQAQIRPTKPNGIEPYNNTADACSPSRRARRAPS